MNPRWIAVVLVLFAPGANAQFIERQCLARETECTAAFDSAGNPIQTGGMLDFACGDMGRPVDVLPCDTFDPEGRPAQGVIIRCEICPAQEPLVTVCGPLCPAGYGPVESVDDPDCGDFGLTICALE